MKWIWAGAMMIAGVACVGTPDSEEDTGEAQEALPPHDGKPGGSHLGPGQDCEDDCRALMRGCFGACDARDGRTAKRDRECYQGCAEDFGSCLRDCGYRHGGCDSLNPEDCSEWAHP